MTLFEIIERVKENKTVPYNDLRLALLAMDALHTFGQMDLERVTRGEDATGANKLWLEENFRRTKTALNADPRTWLGPDNLPESAEYQRRRRMALGILKRVEEKEPTS